MAAHQEEGSKVEKGKLFHHDIISIIGLIYISRVLSSHQDEMQMLVSVFLSFLDLA